MTNICWSWSQSTLTRQQTYTDHEAYLHWSCYQCMLIMMQTYIGLAASICWLWGQPMLDEMPKSTIHKANWPSPGCQHLLVMRPTYVGQAANITSCKVKLCCSPSQGALVKRLTYGGLVANVHWSWGPSTLALLPTDAGHESNLHRSLCQSMLVTKPNYFGHADNVDC